MSIATVRKGSAQSCGVLARAGCLAVLVSLATVLPAPGRSEPRVQDDTIIRVTTPQGTTILVELADTAEERAQGLMFRQFLAKDRGMLFTFSEPQHWTIWMKNTRIPLDIIWLDGEKRIVHVERNVPACHLAGNGCPQYQPNQKAMYVLELAAGSAESLKLGRGVRLDFQVPNPSVGR